MWSWLDAQCERLTEQTELVEAIARQTDGRDAELISKIAIREVKACKLITAHLIHFAVRVGARRAVDAATCLARAGYQEAARIADEQARLIGAMQHPLVVRKDTVAATALRALAPTYDRLKAALEDGC